jgi:predicted 2-oxoglutarate/Fe(II)-dependent dioxygenase YbiX
MPNIKVVPNFVSAEDVQTLIAYIDANCENEDLFRKNVGIANNEGFAYRSIFPMEKDYRKHDPEIVDMLIRYTNLFMEEAKKHYEYEGDLYIENIAFTKLTEGVQLRIHQDTHALTPPLYSGMLYLNNDFEGGEVVFLDSYTPETNFDVYTDDMVGLPHRPSPGELVIFESKTWHGSTKVSKSARYAIALWSTPDKLYSFDL